jgi:DNA topoisomerase I
MIRARVKRDIARSGMQREKVVAAIVHLLDTTLIRVGSVEYAREKSALAKCDSASRARE